MNVCFLLHPHPGRLYLADTSQSIHLADPDPPASCIWLLPHKGRTGAGAFAVTNSFSSNNNFVLMSAVQSNLWRAVVTADCLEE